LAAKAKQLGRETLRQVATIAKPETLLTWHRKLIVQNAESPCRSPGRPPTDHEIAASAVRMAEENRSCLIKPSTRRVDSAVAAAGMDELSTTAIAGKMTDDMAGRSEEKRGLIAEEPLRTRCHYHSHGNKPRVGIRLTVALPASSREAKGVRRRTRRDRLLNQTQREAA
jgi:hypothetical protein